MNDAQHSLKRGSQFPYDAPDAWWHSLGAAPPPAIDKAHAAARGILYDLCDRSGVKREFEEIDETTRVEIVASLAEIIRIAMFEEGES